ncbi:MAG TPA: 50S ribosomal protein L23 [Bacteroidota bacterium]|nr:50S ribosomal protein L23 [Bacteroidota bacterium]
MADILVRPILTEKISKLQENRQYAFEVPVAANKIDIERAVQKKFRVTVTSVRTQRVRGKEKVQLTRRGRFGGKTRSWKKALVTLKQGDKIDFFENV